MEAKLASVESAVEGSGGGHGSSGLRGKMAGLLTFKDMVQPEFNGKDDDGR